MAMYYTETDQSVNAALSRYFHEYVELSRKEAKKNKDIAFPNVNNMLLYINMQDPRFSKEPIRAGSYWQGLKVGQADEFDYSVVLEGITNWTWGGTDRGPRYYGFNKNKEEGYEPEDLKVVKTSTALPPKPAGYEYLYLGNIAALHETYKDLTFEGDLIPFLVRRKLKQLLQVSKRNLDLRGEVRQSRKSHGPALTTFFTFGTREMGIDFAPLIRLRLPYPDRIKWPHSGARWPDSTKIEKIKRIGIDLVAKKDFWWLLSFVKAEKELVAGIDSDGGRRKQLHRTMKKMNGDVWCNTSNPVISSYILKNIWFWEIEEYPSVRDWDNDHLWIRFKSMTTTLLECIQKRLLKQYFHPDINLMENRSLDDMDVVEKKIIKFLKDPMPYFEIDSD